MKIAEKQNVLGKDAHNSKIKDVIGKGCSKCKSQEPLKEWKEPHSANIKTNAIVNYAHNVNIRKQK